MKTRHKYYIWGALIAVVAALIALLVYFAVMSNTYKIQLENNYKRAFYELSNNLQSIELDLSKLVATNDISTQRDILNDIYQITNTANGNLGVLPISNDKIKNVNRYLNTLGGYSYSLLQDVNNGQKLTSDQLDNITWLHTSSKAANYDVAQYVNAQESGKLIIKDVQFGNGTQSLYDGGLSNVDSSNSTMPTLIYDGPFADSVVNKEIKGLHGDLITKEQAMQVALDSFNYFDNYDITYINDTDGKFATYNFKLQAKDYSLYAQITKVGGFVLSLNNLEDKYITPRLDNDSARLLADNYLLLLGLDDMKCVWTQDMGNIVYFNYAYTINDVVYYPDLIKVKVDKGLQRVTGMDASNYAYNHTQRAEYVTQISADNAKSMLSPALTVVNVTKCVIPGKYSGEHNAYEFECTWEEYTYFVYLSTLDGKELNIARLVDTTSGMLTQ